MRSRILTVVPLLGLVAALAALLPCTAFACSCAQPGPPDEALNDATAVFAGRVVSVVEAPRGGQGLPISRQVRLEVSQLWKGPDATLIEVVTGQGDGDCGIGFQAGSEYLVYARTADGFLYTGLCSRTARLDAAGADLAALGAGSAPTVSGITGPVVDGAVRSATPETPSVLPDVGRLNPVLWFGGAVLLVAGTAVAWFIVRRR